MKSWFLFTRFIFDDHFEKVVLDAPQTKQMVSPSNTAKKKPCETTWCIFKLLSFGQFKFRIPIAQRLLWVTVEWVPRLRSWVLSTY